MGRAKIISVDITDAGDGSLRATSRQMEGLFIHGESEEELREVLPAVLEAMFRAVGETVRVVAADSDFGIPMPWVVLPKDADRVPC